MKVIFRNCTTEYQSIEYKIAETASNAAQVKVLDAFKDIRLSKTVKLKITITDIGVWDKEYLPFSLGKGDIDTPSHISEYIGTRFEISTKNINKSIKEIQVLNFSNTSVYPDTQALKFSIVTSNYEEGQKAKTVKYTVEYIIV